jgi:hypothetical protein
MRKFGIAVGVVLSAAMILGAAYAGTFLAGGAVGDTKPTARARGAAAVRHHRKVRHKRGKRPRAEWSDSADAVCNRAKREARAVAKSLWAHPGRRSQRQLVLKLLTAGVRIQGRVLARLRGLKPRRDDRGQVTSALAILAREQRTDQAALAALRRHWNPRLLARQLSRDRRWNASLQFLFTGLGAFECVELMRPTS